MGRQALKGDADGDGQDKLGPRHGDRRQPTETLELIYTQVWVADPEPVTTQDRQFSPKRSCALAEVKCWLRVEPRPMLLPQVAG